MNPVAYQPVSQALDSPWTDARAWITSVLIHGLLLGIVWRTSAWFEAEQSRAHRSSSPLSVELARDDTDGTGEGAAEVREGLTFVTDGDQKSEPDPERLIAHELDRPEMLPGLAGRGMGQGGGSGGGAMEASQPRFFGQPESARSIAFVIDRSGSMNMRGAIERAKRELLLSLDRMAADARFVVIFFNADVTPYEATAWQLVDLLDRPKLEQWLASLRANGGTRPRPALSAAFGLKPEALFLVTDGQALTHSEVDAIIVEAAAAGTRIHVIDLGSEQPAGEGAPLRRLGDQTGGSYRQVGLGS